MKDVIVKIANDIAPELERLIGNTLFGDPEERDKLVEFLWDNKVGILRVLEEVAHG